jgi:hypothetical protein
MGLREQHEKLATNHKDAKYRFILTELDLALTFCEMAESSDKAKSERNTENAWRAYNAANHFFENSGFSKSMQTVVQEKLSRLQTVLKHLKA